MREVPYLIALSALRPQEYRLAFLILLTGFLLVTATALLADAPTTATPERRFALKNAPTKVTPERRFAL